MHPLHTHACTHTGLYPDSVYTVFVTSETNITDQIHVEEIFILERGVALIQATNEFVNEQMVMGVTVSVVAIVTTAIAVISVVICIACVCYKKRVRNLEIDELREMQPNPSYRQATQLQPNPLNGEVTQSNDASSDIDYEVVDDGVL